MYYERYYASHLDQKQQEFDRLVQSARDTNTGTTPATTDTVSAQNPIKRLRAQIQQTVRDKAKKVTKSRHFIPALAGVLVLFAFVFLQYNRVLFGMAAAYTTPGNVDPQNIIVNPSSDAPVGPDPRLIIPKLNVDVPVIYGVNAADHNAQMKAMEKGAAHFAIAGANAVPGQVGNAVFSAHSSNDAFAPGDHKFVFAQNEKLVKDDIIYMHYQGKRYTYAVTKKEVVLPNEVSRIQIQTDKPILTLISCVPLGTAEKRLLVFAEQISPDPSGATKSTEPVTTQSGAIPGKPSPTLLERLFGAKE
jgi:sortase family protein